MDRYNRGEHVLLEFKNYNHDTGDLEDCDTGYPLVEIVDPKGVTKVEGSTQMSKSVKGSYIYWCLVPADGNFGWWNTQLKGITGARTTIIKSGFEVQ